MPGLFIESGIDKGLEQDLKKLNAQYNRFTGTVEKGNDAMAKSFTNLAASVGAAFSVAQIVRFGKDSVNLYRQQQKALAQVEQGLKSTGNAAGLTFEELQKGASDLQKTTLFGDEEILQDATAQLLTFTNIADEQFTRTQKVALDLATRLGGDLKSSSIQLGKALNDPVANLSALSRSGIQFSEEQKKLIKTLAETGRLAEAQTVILDELETQYGGSAEAAAKADGGFTQLSNSIGDVQETIGGVITEGLQPFIAEIQEFLNSLSEEDIRNFIENVKDGAQVIGILVTAITAWKAGLLIMNQIQKINTALTALNTRAQLASARAGKQVSAVNVLMANSMKKLKVAFAANPIGLIVTGLTLAIPLIQKFTSEISDATYVQNELIDVNKKAEKSVAQQQVTLNQLLAIARDETASLEARQEAVRQLNEISPEYLGNLTLQSINTEEAKKATEDYTEALLKQAKVQAATEKLVEIEKKIIDIKRQSVKESTNFFETLNDIIESGFNKEEAYRKIAETSAKNKAEEEKKLIKVREELLKITTEEANQEIALAQNRSKTGASSKVIKDALKNFKKLLSEQKKAYENYNKDIEGLTGERLEIVQKEYEGLTKQGTNYLDFLQKLLAQEKDAKKQTVIKREIDVVTLQNTILEQKAAEELFAKTKQDLKELEEAYRTYSQKRAVIEKEYNEKILSLRSAGYTAQAQQAEKALQNELKKLDASILSQNAVFQKWVSEDLPSIAKEGISALNAELDKVTLALNTEGLDPEQVLVYQREIDILKGKITELVDKEKESPQTWKDTLEIINGVNQLVNDLANSFEGLDEVTRQVLVSITKTASGVLNMITAFKALNAATKTLEKASAILAIISATMQIINVISGLFKNNIEARKKAYAEELRRVQEVNVELIKQNSLYREGNELFSQDRWGTALSGLQAYNEALDLQSNILSDIEDIQTLVSAFAATGLAQSYDILSELLNDLVDDYGRVDKAALQVLLDSELIDEVLRAQLESLLETTDLLEQTYAQFGEYISGIFGGLGDEITQAFQTMFESGDDAMKALESSFSDMIEKFTRDALEFAFLQPYLNELNNATKVLGEQYARGEITAEELQTNIINTLGSFYDELAELQPAILQAFEEADRIAEAAGFAEAFDPDTQETEITVEPEIDIPVVEIPEVIIPNIDIPVVEIPEVDFPNVEEVQVEEVKDVSTEGQIRQAITEETGTILAGRIGALVLSNERILLNSTDMLDYAVQNLVYMKEIRNNTNYLPEIAENTRKTFEKLESV